MKRNRHVSVRMLGAIAILAAGSALAGGCSLLQGGAAGAAGDNPKQLIKTVKVEKIAKQKIGDPVEVTAEVISSLQRQLVAKQGGEVAEIFKKRGEAVKAGETVLRLTSTETESSVEKARLDLGNAEDTLARTRSEGAAAVAQKARALDQLKRNFNKLRNDYDAGTVTPAELETAQTALKNAESESNMFRQQQQASLAAAQTAVYDAKQALEEAERAYSDLEVKAPITGILTAMPAEVGMSLSAGGDAGLIEVIDPVKVKANLSADMAKFAKGKRELTYYSADDEVKKRAAVSFLASVIDPGTKAYDLILEVPNPDMSLKPGMKVRVQLTDESEQTAVAIPTQSILKEGDETYVFVVAGNMAEKRRIETGRLNEPLQEVLSGVKENEWLVISGQRQLTNREQVQVQQPASTKK